MSVIRLPNEQALLDYSNSLGTNIISKESVFKDAGDIYDMIENVILPSISDILSNVSDDVFKNSHLLTKFKSIALNINLGDDNKEVILLLQRFFVNIYKEKRNISFLITDVLSNTITSNNFLISDMAIVKLISDITSSSLFAIDFLSHCLDDDIDNNKFNKEKRTALYDGISSFSYIYEFYNEKTLGEHIKDIKKVINTRVTINNDTEEVKTSYIKKLIKGLKFPGMSRFDMNPIYHIRLWLVDKEIEKYDNMINKKRLLELKLLNLENKNNNVQDKKLEKQIEFYKNKIERLEYAISKIENSDI